MSEWLNAAFSGGVSLTRVNPVGIGLLALAVVLLICAKPVSARFPEEERTKVCNLVKLSGLLICASGAAISFI